MAPIRHRGPRRGRTSTRGTKSKESFLSSRLEESVEPDDQPGQDEEVELSDDQHLSSDEEELDQRAVPSNAYSTLLQSFGQRYEEEGPRRKRRRIDSGKLSSRKGIAPFGENELVTNTNPDDVEQIESPPDGEVDATVHSEDDSDNAGEPDDNEFADEDAEDDESPSDSFEQHFGAPDGEALSKMIEIVSENHWSTERRDLGTLGKCTFAVPEGKTFPREQFELSFKTAADLPLKRKLKDPADRLLSQLSEVQRAIAAPTFRYSDMLFGARTTKNASDIRSLMCLHALNHIFKTRDRVIKNNARILKDADDTVEYRDQGFTRPKVLMILPTRHACVRVVKSLLELSQPEQQENKKRFEDQYAEAEEKNMNDKPDDFLELFEGNDDDMFRLGIKFTRKTIKFFAQFYNADLILASPLGLRRAIESGDKQKGGDYDFLSSIELVIVDQGEALLMQNWDHVALIFSHLNLQPREAHGCDFSRVRPWYLDGQAKYLRQTLIFSAYLAPELNALFSQHCKNVFGKVKFAPEYPGAIVDITQSGLQIKQTFSRFSSTSITSDPEQRFKFFSASILPSLTRYPAPPDRARGILIFIPSYFDFVRVRNYFATSLAAQNISFGAISENFTPQDKEVRRARSHFLSGKQSVLLYSGRAHHFFRYSLKGVKRVVFYGLPDNELHYRELVGMVERSIEEGKLAVGEGVVRVMFSKYDALKLERVVGTGRVLSMLKSKSDTFQFT